MARTSSAPTSYKNDNYPNAKPFMYHYARSLPQYIPKPATLCPSSPERPWPLMPSGSFGEEWYQNLINDLRGRWQQETTTGRWSTVTDYSIRMGFGSLHGGILDDKYKDWDPDYYRGHHNSIYAHRNQGFVFNYRDEQPDAHNMSIMLMDRQRKPSLDGQDTQRYFLARANHVWSGGNGLGAAGANIMQRSSGHRQSAGIAEVRGGSVQAARSRRGTRTRTARAAGWT